MKTMDKYISRTFCRNCYCTKRDIYICNKISVKIWKIKYE